MIIHELLRHDKEFVKYINCHQSEVSQSVDSLIHIFGYFVLSKLISLGMKRRFFLPGPGFLSLITI